jgi:hypothetical protein
MRSARSMLAAVVVPFSLVAQAESPTADDRPCAARLCSHWWTNPEAASRCLDRYNTMVSEQQANPYRHAEASGDGPCAGAADSDRCIDPEPAAIGRLMDIYAVRSEFRAIVEMRSGKLAPQDVRAPWERLLWCYDHYQPALGSASYQDVLKCYEPRAAKGLGQPGPPPYFVPRDRLFDGPWVRAHCPERTP